MNKFLHAIVLTMALVFSALTLQAQNGTNVSGVVKDSKGEPIVGAVVMVKGKTNIGVTTDVNGKWSLSIPSSVKQPQLEVSCISYKNQTVAVGSRTVINIVLEDDAEMLEETIVVGYGSMRKSDLTGSVASVKINEEDAAQSTSLDELLQGRAAGVQILSSSAQPDAGVSIRVRGLASFNGSTEPLYVVDGVIINATSSETLMTQGLDNSSSDQEMNGLMGINPQDIASMEILKDASATAIYGAQGANGVVLITTKSASRERPVVQFTAGTDISQRNKRLDVLTFDEWVDYYRDLGGDLTNIYEDPETKSGLKVKPVDWQEYCCQTAVNQRYYFSIAGRPKSISYMFSMGYNNKEGVVKGSKVNQYTMRLNLDKSINKRLSIGTKTSLAFINSLMAQGSDGARMNAASSLLRSMIITRPYMRLDSEEDDDDYEEVDETGSFRSGPDKWLSEFKNSREEFRVTPSFYIKYKIAPWLSYKLSAGGDYRTYEVYKWKSARINTTAEGNIGAAGNYELTSFNVDAMFDFDKKFGRGHRITGTAGITASQRDTRSQAVEGWGIVQHVPQISSLNSAPNTLFRYTESRSSLLSALVRAIYNYKDRYVLTATYRIDGSSRFQGANKWSAFPSFAFAWRLNQEPWFKVPVVSMAKVRLSWGQVGNQSVSNYQTLSNFSNAFYADNTPGNDAEKVVALYPSNLSNPGLKWETTESVNAGIDLGLWKGRFTVSVDAYYKKTIDLLQTKKIPLSSGFTSIWINEGSIENKGIEVQLEATPFKTRDFEWNISGNISFNRNKILAIGADAERRDIYLTPDHHEEVEFFYGDRLGSSAPTYPGNIFIVGKPMGLFYGLKTDGIVQQGETGVQVGANGNPRQEGWINFVDINGNGYIDDDDRTIIGNPNPDFTYGFSTSLSYKRLTLSASFAGSYGNDVINISNILDKFPLYSTRNIFREGYYDAWSPENPNGSYPGLKCTNLNDMYIPMDRTIEDASYLRISKVTLSYDVPLSKKSFVKRLVLSSTLGNPYVFTKYSGWDPDVNSFGKNVKKMGVDVGSYPSARSLSFDVKFTF